MILQVTDAQAELTTNAARNIEVEMGATGLTGLLERWFRRSFCVTSPHGPSVRRPFCSRAAAHGAKDAAFRPSTRFQRRTVVCSLGRRVARERGARQTLNAMQRGQRVNSVGIVISFWVENGAVVSLRGAAGPSSQLLACVRVRV